MTQPYIRPAVDTETHQDAVRTATAFVTRKSRPELIAVMIALLCENARLLAEVNAHRATLGIEPLPVYNGLK